MAATEPAGAKAPATLGTPRCPAPVQELRDRVSDFVHERVQPAERLLDAGGAPATAAWSHLRRAALEAGLWAMPLPVELGGQGLPLDLYAHLAEAEGASDHGASALGSAPLLDVRMLRNHARPEVQERVLRGLVHGELHCAYAMTEPGVPGTEPLSTTTRAHQENNGTWVVTGRKWFTTGAAEADFVTVLARTDGKEEDRHGLSLLLVPTTSPGFRLVRELPVLGAAGQWEFALDGVRVPDSHLVGPRGDALSVAAERLQLGRTLRCLRWLGQARRAFDLMCARAAGRGRLADRQLVQQHVFESLLALRSCRPLVYEAVSALSAGEDAHVETGLAKVAAARTLHQIADAAIQVHGAAGLGPDTPLPALLRTGRAARILDGPDELHITSVAKRVLRTY
ncbi:acyl-CoA dehydrogenase family protein [Streptomyces sp. NPDC006879]|uniref:acyl-CoA dehydrogenase family protein n=1 Tax=Streptomyces sp. NPDC006879 TaxID=3364767 RepID=UPI0036B12516